MKANIHAIIRTLTPLHIAAPSDVRFDVSTGRITFTDPNAMPCTGIQRMALPIFRPIKSDDGNDRRSQESIPVIAANNVAGRLRRHAASLVLAALKDKGQKVSLTTYGTLQCGAWTGKPDGTDMSYSEYRAAKDHVYLGLFGGGPKLMRKAFRTHNALPSLPMVREIVGSIAHPNPNHMLEYADPWQLTRAWGFRRVDDLRDLTNLTQAQATVRDFEAAFNARQALIIEDAAKGRDGGEKQDRVSTKTYSAVEFVLPGVPFEWFAELDDVSDAQMGLFLASLDSFAATERLGGYVRNGFGAFRLDDVRLEIDGEPCDDSPFHNGRLETSSPQVKPYLDAWRAAAADLDAATLDAMLRPADPKPKKPAKGKETTAASAEA